MGLAAEAAGWWLLCVLFYSQLPVVTIGQQDSCSVKASCTYNATSRTRGMNEANNGSTCTLMANSGSPAAESTFVEVDMGVDHCVYTSSKVGRVMDLTTPGTSAKYGFSSAKAGKFDMHAAELTGCGMPFCFLDDFADDCTECTVITVVQPNQPCMITKCKAGYGTCTNADPRACTTLRCNNGEAELRPGDDGPKGDLAFTCQPCRAGYFNEGDSHRCTACKSPSCGMSEDLVPCTGKRDAHCTTNGSKVGTIAGIVVGTTVVYVFLSLLYCFLSTKFNKFRHFTDKLDVGRLFRASRPTLDDQPHGFFGLCVACQPEASTKRDELFHGDDSAEQLTKELAQWGYLMSYPVLTEAAKKEVIMSTLEAVATECRRFEKRQELLFESATVILVFTMHGRNNQGQFVLVCRDGEVLGMADVLKHFPKSTNILVLLDACYSGAAYTERHHTVITAASARDKESRSDGKSDFMLALHELVGQGQAKVHETVSAMGLCGSVANWCQKQVPQIIASTDSDFTIHRCSKSCGGCPARANMPLYSLPKDELERYTYSDDEHVDEPSDDAQQPLL